MTEKTIVKVIPGLEQDWIWYGDANVVAISDRICPEEHPRIIDEVQSRWRRRWLQVVPA